MRFLLLAALIGAVAPLCAQTTLTMPLNVTFTGTNQEHAQLIELHAPATATSVTLDLSVSTSHANGAYITLYSASDEYTYAQWQGALPGVCSAVTAGPGQASGNHTTMPLSGLHRLVVLARPYPGTGAVLDCVVTLSCNVGTLQQGIYLVAQGGKGIEALGLAMMTGAALSHMSSFIVNLTLDGVSGAEPCAFHLSLTDVDVTLSDVTGAMPVVLDTWSATGNGSAYKSRGLDPGVRLWRIEVQRKTLNAFFGMELRVGGQARITAMSWGPGPTTPPPPSQHYGASAGGSGGGGCAAGASGVLAPLALLTLLWRRRRAA
ncbi:MAG: hypothetical protein HS108_14775 [Planctomycetes bacterium]|jgi:hypothetical protein|nr:hypothetical protein [Planctomycetota bacterium]MCL4730295.1 hypothetical protein [Planctomycetota bacterium]